MHISKAIICQLACLVLPVAGLAVTRDSYQETLLANVPTPTLQPTSFQTHTLIAPTSREPQRSEEQPPVVTTPPSERPDLKKRQPCCFNEQGFRVDCATWTGYYYTWGPQGNPYEGGPQCDGNWNGGSGGGPGNGNNGGNGQNNGNGQVTVFNGGSDESPRAQIAFVLGAVLLLFAIVL